MIVVVVGRPDAKGGVRGGAAALRWPERLARVVLASAGVAGGGSARVAIDPAAAVAALDASGDRSDAALDLRRVAAAAAAAGSALVASAPRREPADPSRPVPPAFHGDLRARDAALSEMRAALAGSPRDVRAGPVGEACRDPADVGLPTWMVGAVDGLGLRVAATMGAVVDVLAAAVPGARLDAALRPFLADVLDLLAAEARAAGAHPAARAIADAAAEARRTAAPTGAAVASLRLALVAGAGAWDGRDHADADARDAADGPAAAALAALAAVEALAADGARARSNAVEDAVARAVRAASAPAAARPGPSVAAARARREEARAARRAWIAARLVRAVGAVGRRDHAPPQGPGHHWLRLDGDAGALELPVHVSVGPDGSASAAGAADGWLVELRAPSLAALSDGGQVEAALASRAGPSRREVRRARASWLGPATLP